MHGDSGFVIGTTYLCDEGGVDSDGCIKLRQSPSHNGGDKFRVEGSNQLTYIGQDTIWNISSQQRCPIYSIYQVSF